MIDPILRDAESKMSKSVDHFGSELVSIRTGRANPALIDKVMVPYYGTPTPLNQLAQISAPEPRLLVVQVYDKSQIGAIEKALRWRRVRNTKFSKYEREPTRFPLIGAHRAPALLPSPCHAWARLGTKPRPGGARPPLQRQNQVSPVLFGGFARPVCPPSHRNHHGRQRALGSQQRPSRELRPPRRRAGHQAGARRLRAAWGRGPFRLRVLDGELVATAGRGARPDAPVPRDHAARDRRDAPAWRAHRRERTP